MAPRAGLWGRAVCAAGDQPPRVLGDCYCSPSLTHSHLQQLSGARGLSVGLVLIICPWCSVCGPWPHPASLPGWSFHPGRALCSAPAAREQLRNSSGSHTEPGQVMLSPFHRWVAEDWRDADHKHLFILGAQLELCRAGDFTALEQALRGRCWHCRRGSSQ